MMYLNVQWLYYLYMFVKKWTKMHQVNPGILNKLASNTISWI